MAGRLTAIVALLLTLPAFAEVSRLATVTPDIQPDGTGWTSIGFQHTVDSDATLLMVTFNIQANVSGNISSVVWDAAGVNESLTLVHATTSSGSAGDRNHQTWGLVNPTAKTANITINASISIDDSTTVAVNYSGTKTGSVADATNLVAADVDDIGSATFDIASGGTSGNLLFAAAGFRGSDQDPVSLSAGWSEVAEAAPASGSDNAVVKVADKAAPSAITMTPQVTDEYAGHMIELVSGRCLPCIIHYYMNH